jgi:hypothetical protein
MALPVGHLDSALDFSQANACLHWTQAPKNKTIQPPSDHLAFIKTTYG